MVIEVMMMMIMLLLVAVKTKFAYAYTTEFPYRMTHILECEFFLLEAMVIVVAGAVYCVNLAM